MNRISFRLMHAVAPKRSSDIAELWFATVSLGTIFLLSTLLHCCILDRGDHHGRAPLCARIAAALAQSSADDHATTLPAQRQQRGCSDSDVTIASSLLCHAPHRSSLRLASPASTSSRDQMAFGALRIDDDVGLHDLFATYLI